MLRFTAARGLGVLAIVAWATVALAAELPTAEEVLAIYRANRDKFAQMHLQDVYTYETTEAAGRMAQIRADEKERVYKLLSQAKPEAAKFTVEGKTVEGEEAKRILAMVTGPAAKKEIEMLRQQQKPWRMTRLHEIFASGDDYQVRSPARELETEEELAAWAFPGAPLSAETLRGAYGEMSIYSRAKGATPSARWWHASADSHAYLTQKHYGDLMSYDLPPFTMFTQPRWDNWHPYDGFFSQPADKYRVVREEVLDGRTLTVVDVAVPLAADSSGSLVYRAWLDLARGAVPMRVYQAQGSGQMERGFFDRALPWGITITHAVRELPGGACYPAKTVLEEWEVDPAVALTKEEWDEVRAGKRKEPRAVTRRHTWDVALVEIPTHFAEGFFVLPYPEGQKLYDHDAERMVGAMPEKPPVEVGQQAPPLSIARWVDGKQRTLDDLKGQVVVLDFWGLWCGPCRASVPELKELQARFRGKPVTFVSIHTADKDPAALATKIAAFQKETGWEYLAAIDSGKMIEDSVTSNAYGVRGFPETVVIGPDGKVAYAEPRIDGPYCDEEDPAVLAAFEKKFNELWKGWFEAVGEKWPVAKGLDEKQQTEIFQRVQTLYISQRIEAAIKK